MRILKRVCNIGFLGSLIFLGCENENSGNKDLEELVEFENSDSFTINGGSDCTQTPVDQSIYKLETKGDLTEVTFNYVPNHNSNAQVTSRERTFSFVSQPTFSSSITPVANTDFTGQNGHLGWIFGIMNTGVPFDPVANEPWIDTSNGSKNYEWNQEVLSTKVGLRYDCNNAHDPSRYHYHGTPIEYIVSIENGLKHSSLLGYAADGFPIYYKYGYEDPNDATSNIISLESSYSLKEGFRPGNGISAPNGAFDGEYVADYIYLEGLNDLDECNGRWSKTPEYPNGIYAYYITDEFPSIPRYFKGTPSEDFKIGY